MASGMSLDFDPQGISIPAAHMIGGKAISGLGERITVNRPSDLQPLSEIEDGGEFRITRKASDRDGKTIVLEVTALDTVPDQLLRKIDLMIQSFRLTDRSV